MFFNLLGGRIWISIVFVIYVMIMFIMFIMLIFIFYMRVLPSHLFHVLSLLILSTLSPHFIFYFIILLLLVILISFSDCFFTVGIWGGEGGDFPPLRHLTQFLVPQAGNIATTCVGHFASREESSPLFRFLCRDHFRNLGVE